MTQPDNPFCDGNQQQLNDESVFRLPYCTAQTHEYSLFDYTKHEITLAVRPLHIRMRFNTDYSKLMLCSICAFGFLRLLFVLFNQMKMELFVNANKRMRSIDDCNWPKCHK